MKRFLLGVHLLFLISVLQAYGQNAVLVSGKVLDEKGSPIIGASVGIKSTVAGTITKEDGSFQIKTNLVPPFVLQISYIGAETQEYQVKSSESGIKIMLNSRSILADEVVVSASRIEESTLKAPVSIEKLDIRAIRESPAPSFFDALENLKGVQMTTLSLGYKVPNTRGFSGTTNSRFLQLVDGADNTSPGIGAPIANAVGPTELDIESVELIPGAASAIYGLNAINGVSNMRTKSPFLYQGLSVYQKTGVNHVDGKDHSPSVYTESALRYATSFHDKLGVKVNLAFSQGYDWVADDHRDLNPTGNQSLGLVGEDNPGQDPINSYGNESSNRRTVSMLGKNYVVARTGYYEKDFVDYTVNNLKADAALHYRLNNHSELSYSYRIGKVDNMYQRGNRIKLDNSIIQQHKVEWQGQNFFLRGYYTHENTGDSYNARPMAENLDKAFKSDNQWFSDFRSAFESSVNGGSTVPVALQAARASADRGRYQPGTPEFEAKLKELGKINNWDIGSALILKSAFYHVEGQYDFSPYVKFAEVLAGFNYRNYVITPDGNSFVDPKSINSDASINSEIHNNVTYANLGGFVQMTKKLFNDRLKLVGSLRVDKIEYFSPKVNPRIAAVYTVAEKHNFRVSYQNGFRFPTLFEGFSYVDNGGVKRLGGIEVMSKKLGIFENSYTRASQDAFIKAVNAEVNQNTSADPVSAKQNQAIANNKGLLQKSPYTYLKPEHINSFEVGYKSVLFNNSLFIDADYYYNIYQNFIGQVEVTKPNTGTIGVDESTVSAAFTQGQYKRYRMWTNSLSKVHNYGASLGLTYNFYKTFTLGGNVSYAKLSKISEGDALLPTFNTPEWITNVTFGNRQIFENTGFNIVWRHQSKFYWLSPLADGIVPNYDTFDAQVTQKIPKWKMTAKLGASNVFNNRYIQYTGGPVIGGFYYLTLVVDGLSLKR